MMTHPQLRLKLEAVGFGVFVPFFFVASGVRQTAAAGLLQATSLSLRQSLVPDAVPS